MTLHAIARKKPRSRPEQGLHRFTIQLLKLNGAKGVLFYHCPNGESRSRLIGAILAGLGVLPGVADICLVLPGGRAAFLELKAPGGRPLPSQRAFRPAAEAAGALYAIASTPEAVQAVLAGWGALREPSHALAREAAE